MDTPANIQLIGNELCIAWADGTESYFTGEFLRKYSPSAANIGEVDILGQRHGSDGPNEFPGVTITSWEQVGNYAIRPLFSDGHESGLFSWEYLSKLAERQD